MKLPFCGKSGVRNIANKEAAFSEAAFFCGLSGCFKRIQGAISVVCMNFLPYPVLDREEVVLCDGLGL